MCLLYSSLTISHILSASVRGAAEKKKNHCVVIRMVPREHFSIIGNKIKQWLKNSFIFILETRNMFWYDKNHSMHVWNPETIHSISEQKSEKKKHFVGG